jgi:hypothetical protein
MIGMADPDDEKGSSQVPPDKPDGNSSEDRQGDRERHGPKGEERPSADKEHPDSF